MIFYIFNRRHSVTPQKRSRVFYTDDPPPPAAPILSISHTHPRQKTKTTKQKQQNKNNKTKQNIPSYPKPSHIPYLLTSAPSHPISSISPTLILLSKNYPKSPKKSPKNSIKFSVLVHIHKKHIIKIIIILNIFATDQKITNNNQKSINFKNHYKIQQKHN